MHDTMMITTVVAMMIMPLVMFVMVMAMSVVVRMISKNYSTQDILIQILLFVFASHTHVL